DLRTAGEGSRKDRGLFEREPRDGAAVTDLATVDIDHRGRFAGARNRESTDTGGDPGHVVGGAAVLPEKRAGHADGHSVGPDEAIEVARAVVHRQCGIAARVIR